MWDFDIYQSDIEPKSIKATMVKNRLRWNLASRMPYRHYKLFCWKFKLNISLNEFFAMLCWFNLMSKTYSKNSTRLQNYIYFYKLKVTVTVMFIIKTFSQLRTEQKYLPIQLLSGLSKFVLNELKQSPI